MYLNNILVTHFLSFMALNFIKSLFYKPILQHRPYYVFIKKEITQPNPLKFELKCITTYHMAPPQFEWY